MQHRRDFVRVAFGALVGALTPGALWAAVQQPNNSRRRITVYKSPDCECCKKWVELVRPLGWIVDVKNEEDMDKVKNRARVPRALRSCHTAVVGRYVFEGHVPIDLVKTFMERPRFAGLAVPGMPIGSPGMEVPGQPADRYQVIGFYPDGRTFVYATR